MATKYKENIMTCKGQEYIDQRVEEERKKRDENIKETLIVLERLNRDLGCITVPYTITTSRKSWFPLRRKYINRNKGTCPVKVAMADHNIINIHYGDRSLDINVYSPDRIRITLYWNYDYETYEESLKTISFYIYNYIQNWHLK